MKSKVVKKTTEVVRTASDVVKPATDVIQHAGQVVEPRLNKLAKGGVVAGTKAADKAYAAIMYNDAKLTGGKLHRNRLGHWRCQ